MQQYIFLVQFKYNFNYAGPSDPYRCFGNASGQKWWNVTFNESYTHGSPYLWKPLEPFSLHLYSLSSSPKSYRSNVSSRKPVRSKPASTRLCGTTCWRTPRSRTTRPCWNDWRMSRPVSWPSWLSSMTTPSMTCCPNRLWVRQGDVVPFTHAPHPQRCAWPGRRPAPPPASLPHGSSVLIT